MADNVRSLALLFFVLVAGCSSEEPANLPKRDGGTATGAAAFKKDVVPLLQEGSCTLTGCHGAKENNRGVYLTGDPAQMHTELLKESSVAKGMKIVAPGDPENSWLMIKLDGKQAQFSAKCADTSGTLPAGDCGQPMPQGDDPSLGQLSQAKRDVIRAWIKAGAKND